ncbi:MAG: CpaF family protein [Dehalococcoidia bacterium]
MTIFTPRRDSAVGLEPEQSELVHRIHQRLLQEIDLPALEKRAPGDARPAVEATVRALANEMAGALYGEAKEAVVRAVLDEAVGLGPIQPLIDDPNVSEVMVNAPDDIYAERDGVIYPAPVRFRDVTHILRIIDRIIAPLGRRVDESSPLVDARLPDGSRVNIVIPPLVPRSPTITIRKFRSDKHTVEDLLGNGTLTRPLAEFLAVCIKQKLNIVISGGSGTGKTTMLNALSGCIPNNERVVTIEDPIELKLQQRHAIAMEARPANMEGRNEVSQRDLLRNALRMRPDRIIVGEVRGGEAFDMMQAMNTGHEGSLTTVHANSTRDALARIENMILMAGLDLPVRAMREQMASALQLLVHLTRFSDGRRRVVAVAEVTGIEGEVVTMKDLFRFEREGVDGNGAVQGRLTPTGMVPTFAERFASAGVNIDWTTYESIGGWGAS